GSPRPPRRSREGRARSPAHLTRLPHRSRRHADRAAPAARRERMTTAPAVRVGVIGRGCCEPGVALVYGAAVGLDVVDVVTPRDDGAVTELCARRDIDLISVHSPP